MSTDLIGAWYRIRDGKRAWVYEVDDDYAYLIYKGRLGQHQKGRIMVENIEKHYTREVPDGKASHANTQGQ